MMGCVAMSKGKRLRSSVKPESGTDIQGIEKIPSVR